MANVLVAGAGGFIGGHLVGRLLAEGHDVRAVDVVDVDRWWQRHDAAAEQVYDLSELSSCLAATHDVDVVYNLAAEVGGIGYIQSHRADCALSVLINTNLLRAAATTDVKRYFFASSACIYPLERQTSRAAISLRESDAYPASPEEGYGWEKLYGELLCRYFTEEKGLTTRVARFHNTYGPHGSWNDGREKAPAAICRKVATAKLTGRSFVDVWGDGEQTRSFTYVDDTVDLTLALTASDVTEPVNVGSDELVTIDQLVTVVEDVAGVRLDRRYQRDAPRGVNGRNSNNSLIIERLGREPTTSLRTGIERTYPWIEEQVANQLERGGTTS